MLFHASKYRKIKNNKTKKRIKIYFNFVFMSYEETSSTNRRLYESLENLLRLKDLYAALKRNDFHIVSEIANIKKAIRDSLNSMDL